MNVLSQLLDPTPVVKPTMQRHRQSGFSLIEVMIATTMMAFLSMMIAGLWVGFARSVSDTVAQAQVVSNAHMALESFRRDLGGSLLEDRSGTKFQGSLVGRLVTVDDRLMLCFDGDPTNKVADWAAPDTVIVYELQGGQLIRTNQQSGNSFVCAENVSDLQLTDLASGVQIDMTVERGDFTRTYTLISEDP